MSIEGTAKTEYASLSGKIHTFVVDKTLSISGACADAKSTGDAIEEFDKKCDEITEAAEEAKKAYEAVKKAYEDTLADMSSAADEAAEKAAKEAVKTLTAGDVNAYTKEETSEQIRINRSEVGDTVRTYRTDLGENWALCNGDAFDPNEYPELAKVTPDVLAFASTPGCISKSSFFGYYVHGVTQIGEYVMWLSYDSTGEALQLHYSSDRLETWQTVAVVSSSDTISHAKLYYIKGVWYILYAKSNRVYLHYCTDEFVTGAWSSAVTVASGCGTVLNMWFNEATQQYMIASSGYGSGTNSNTSSYPYLLASYDYAFNNTSVTKLHTTSSAYNACFVADTKYVFVGCNNYSTFEIVCGSLAYPTNANFVQTSVGCSSTYTTSGSAYTNGKLCVPISGAIRVFSNLDDFSDYVDMTIPSALTDLNASLTSAKVIYANGKYLAFAQTGSGSSAVLYLCAFDLDAKTSDYVNLNLVKDTNGNAMLPNSYTSGYSGTFEQVFENCFLIWNSTSSLYRVPLYALPTSSPAPMYEYIKVKEGI